MKADRIRLRDPGSGNTARPSSWAETSNYADTGKEAALKHGIRVLQPEKISGSPEMEEIIELVPDVIVTAAFGQFLPEKLLQVPKLGAINVHASLLPKYREVRLFIMPS